MMNTLKLLAGGVCLALCSLTVTPNAALAHGEKALEPFVRMRTVQFYDVIWSKDQLNVNDEVVVSGKFHVAEDWPRGITKPDAAYLNMSVPGPVFIRTERYLNGRPSVSSAALKLGGDYDFKIVMKARLPGRYHAHPFFNLHDVGPVMGPGHWIEIGGEPAAFINQVKTLEGSVIDMESYGLANGIGWHVFWFAVASAWLLWWVRRPLFIPRYKMLHSGREEALISSLDRKIAMALLLGAPVVVVGANAITNRQYPNAIPLQAALDQIEPLAPMVNTGPVEVNIQRTEHHVPARAMTMLAKIHNGSEHPVEVGEFATANVRFLTPMAGQAMQNNSDDLVAREGLSLDSPNPIVPGETRTISITATDSRWQWSDWMDSSATPTAAWVGFSFFTTPLGNVT
jgi:methane/ammonia monooxygenase subunit B